MKPTYIAYEYDPENKPCHRIKVRAWTYEGARAKAQRYFKATDRITIKVERV